MKSKSLVFGFSFVLLGAMILSMVYVQGAISHWDVKKTTIVTETCWLIGYPSRTKCNVAQFKEVVLEETNAHHIALLGPNNQIVIDHKPGHAGHAQVSEPTKHKQRSKLVYDNCGECN
ncbi:MAG: hypothetical protein OXI63_23990 [Candidatus Poribacteria bacterium]|nr:hypothetical protein [Candidatus Poribacteria bacterium]